MQTKIQRHAFAIWLVASCVVVVSCVLNMSTIARFAGEYVPVGNDSFYHATRILDAVRNPAAFYEFDPKIHAPEGSLLVWPWGYDYVMAKLVRLGIAIGLGTDPLLVLLWIPVIFAPLAIALLIALSRRLGLNMWLTTLAALCMALSPATQLLFGFARIDHHYAEMLFVLASLAVGLAWFQAARVASGIALGMLFGASLAVHNGLFVLQIPFLLTLALRWLQGQSPPKRPTAAFAAALLAMALAVLLPSLPFRLGRFEFYTLSWFHFYIVCCTSAVALFLAWLRPSRNSILALAGLGAILLVPLFGEIKLAQSFLAGSLGMLKLILEMASPVQLAFNGNAKVVTDFYSLLIWIAPVTFAICAVQCWRDRQSPRLFVWIASTCGLALLSMQLRLHYFGSVALYLPWLVLLQDYIAKRGDPHRRLALIATLALLLAYIPQIRHVLVSPPPTAGDQWFDEFYPIIPALRQACSDDPGVVLADNNAGHYIRYYTDCSVIDNNFLLTEQQFHKVDEVMRLFSLAAAELPKQAPYVKYVLVRAGDISPRPEAGKFSYSFFGSEPPQLAQTLLLDPPQDVPPQFKLLDKIDLNFKQDTWRLLPYARLYKIEPGASQNASPANGASK